MAGASEVRRRNRSLARGRSSVVKSRVLQLPCNGESTWPSFPRQPWEGEMSATDRLRRALGDLLMGIPCSGGCP